MPPGQLQLHPHRRRIRIHAQRGSPACRGGRRRPLHRPLSPAFGDHIRRDAQYQQHLRHPHRPRQPGCRRHTAHGPAGDHRPRPRLRNLRHHNRITGRYRHRRRQRHLTYTVHTNGANGSVTIIGDTFYTPNADSHDIDSRSPSPSTTATAVPPTSSSRSTRSPVVPRHRPHQPILGSVRRRLPRPVRGWNSDPNRTGRLPPNR